MDYRISLIDTTTTVVLDNEAGEQIVVLRPLSPTAVITQAQFDSLESNLKKFRSLVKIDIVSVSGSDYKASVRAASTTNVASLLGAKTIDGVSCVAGDRVLLKDQTDAGDNGIYVVATGAWSRATDADEDADVSSGMSIFISEGTVNGGSVWVISTPDLIVVGITDLTFLKISEKSTAGSGLLLSGSQLSVDVDDSTVEIDTNKLRVKDAGIVKEKIGADVAGIGLVQNVDKSLEVNVDDSTLEIITNAVRIKDNGVSAVKLTNGAGWAALLAAGLGNSANHPKTTNGVQTLISNIATGRMALIVVTVTEAFSNGDGTQPTFKVGEVDADDKYAATSLFTDATLGSVFVLAGSLTALKNLIVTAVAATGTTSTGAISIMGMVLPATI